MSLNLSSSSEDEGDYNDYDEEEFGAYLSVNYKASVEEETFKPSSFLTSGKAGDEGEKESSNIMVESSEESVVDWEDADDEEDDTKSLTNTMSIRPVVFDLDKKRDMDVKPPSRKKRKRVNVLKNVSPDISRLVLEIHRSHLLSLVSRAIAYSGVSVCNPSEDERHSLLPHLCLSLISEDLFNSLKSTGRERIPSISQARLLFDWFCDLVHNLNSGRMNKSTNGQQSRKRQSKRKRRSQQGSIHQNDFSSDQGYDTGHSLHDRILGIIQSLFTRDVNQLTEDTNTKSSELLSAIFCCFCRAVGWRTRFVSSLRPISKQLTITHPLLASNFETLFLSIPANKNEVLRHKVYDRKGDTSNENHYCLCWVEILCNSSSTDSTPTWIHADVSFQIFNGPKSIEIIEALADVERIPSRAEILSLMERPKARRSPVSYVLAVEHDLSLTHDTLHDSFFNRTLFCITDVTPRYARHWTRSLLLRGSSKSSILKNKGRCSDVFWSGSIRKINHSLKLRRRKNDKQSVQKSGKNATSAIEIDISPETSGNSSLQRESRFDEEINSHELNELQRSAANEIIPTSKVGFNNHPFYAIKSTLNKDEVIYPDASKRMCGIFKGEIIYRRADVSKALPERKWLYLGRKVNTSEIARPIKLVKAQKKPVSKGFKALDSYGVGEGNDGSAESRANVIAKSMEDDISTSQVKLYAIWQTNNWSPKPVGSNDTIPTNIYNNIEKELINPGLVHLDEPHMAKVAKKLGIPYAPCLLGFDGYSGNRVPVIRGIVVHTHNADLLREAHVEVLSSELEKSNLRRQKDIYSRWRKLIKGMLTKTRLEEDYPDNLT